MKNEKRFSRLIVALKFKKIIKSLRFPLFNILRTRFFAISSFKLKVWEVRSLF